MNTKNRWVLTGAATVALAAALAACGGAAETSEETPGQEDSLWEPSGRIELTVPSGAGGGTDALGRALAAGLEEVRPGLVINVVNRPGASGATGYTHFYQQAGDPHQLLAEESGIVLAPLALETEWRYDDFTQIGQVSYHMGGIGAAAGRFADLNELIEVAGSGETLVFAVAGGADGLFGLQASAFEELLGDNANIRQVNFETGKDTALALVSGDADFAVTSPEHFTQFIRAGEIDGLAVLTEERIPEGVLSEVPTAVEQGVDLVFAGLRGLAAAPGISEEAEAYWIEAFEEWTQSDSFNEYISTTESAPAVAIGPDFLSSIADFEKVARDAFESRG